MIKIVKCWLSQHFYLGFKLIFKWLTCIKKIKDHICCTKNIKTSILQAYFLWILCLSLLWVLFPFLFIFQISPFGHTRFSLSIIHRCLHFSSLPSIFFSIFFFQYFLFRPSDLSLFWNSTLTLFVFFYNLICMFFFSFNKDTKDTRRKSGKTDQSHLTICHTDGLK